MTAHGVMTEVPTRWFECPACGSEYFTPDARLGDSAEPIGCVLCGSREMRLLLYALEAGSASSAFKNGLEDAQPYTYTLPGRYKITIEKDAVRPS